MLRERLVQSSMVAHIHNASTEEAGKEDQKFTANFGYRNETSQREKKILMLLQMTSLYITLLCPTLHGQERINPVKPMS